MKTTLDLPDELLIAAKKRAAEQRRPLRALVEQGLRAQLSRRPSNKKSKRVRWVTVPGGLPDQLDLANRESMHEWLGRRK
jgi:hypothetical protein